MLEAYNFIVSRHKVDMPPKFVTFFSSPIFEFPQSSVSQTDPRSPFWTQDFRVSQHFSPTPFLSISWTIQAGYSPPQICIYWTNRSHPPCFFSVPAPVSFPLQKEAPNDSKSFLQLVVLHKLDLVLLTKSLVWSLNFLHPRDQWKLSGRFREHGPHCPKGHEWTARSPQVMAVMCCLFWQTASKNALNLINITIIPKL